MTRHASGGWYWRGVVALIVIVAALSPSANVAFGQGTSPIPPVSLYLPALSQATEFEQHLCPTTSTATYVSIPIEGSPRQASYPPVADPDLNLVVRSYSATTALLGLVDIGGHTDANAPRLHTLYAPPRVPTFTGAHRVNDWDWACPQSLTGLGCRGLPLTEWEVTLISMQTAVGEAVYAPDWPRDILSGVYKAMVLYAEAERITLVYTRRDSPAHGYVIHLEGVCVDPNLLSLYQSLDAAGRSSLPGLRSGERVGQAKNASIAVAIRDSGAFMDPRSSKDWWQGR